MSLVTDEIIEAELKKVKDVIQETCTEYQSKNFFELNTDDLNDTVSCLSVS